MKEELFGVHDDIEREHWWFRARRGALRALGAMLLPGHGTVVDVGCGTGADIAAFPATQRRIGLDRSETAIRLARSRHPGVTFEIAELPESGAAAVAEADLVLLCDVLEHVENDSEFLSHLVHAMAPGAHLLMTVPADPRLWSPHDEVYGHHRRYTRDGLRAAWAGLPVECQLLAPFNRRLYPAARMIRRMTARRGHGVGAHVSDLSLPWSPVNEMLRRILEGEVPALTRALAAGTRELPGQGVSLLAVIRRRATPAANRHDETSRVASEVRHG